GERKVVLILTSSSSVVSLDSPLTTADSGSLYDVVQDNSFNPDDELMRKTLLENMFKLLDCLQDTERHVVLCRYFFANGRRTLESIGNDLGLSVENVRQIEIRALKKLRSVSDDMKLS